MTVQERMSIAQYRSVMKLPPVGGIVTSGIKPSKYRSKPAMINRIRFDSLLEGAYYLKLEHLVKTGEVDYYLRQVPIHLPGNPKYVVDFLVFRKGQAPEYVDVKGRLLGEFRLKKKLVEALYPIEIHCIFKKDIELSYRKTSKALSDDHHLIDRFGGSNVEQDV